MDRFIAFLWDDRIDVATKTAAGIRARFATWSVVVDGPGLCVLAPCSDHGQPPVVPIVGMDGVVIGTLFENGEERKGRVRRLIPPTTPQAHTLVGHYLIRHYWGSYVAIWHAPAARTSSILRDPSGAIPCFFCQLGDVQVAGTHAADIVGIDAARFSPDSDHLRAFFVSNHFVTRTTGFAEIGELLPGEMMTWTAGGAPTFDAVWDAHDIARKPSTKLTFQKARRELRTTVETCFTAWGHASGRILVRLSGGLDSSVLACGMRKFASAEVSALHFTSEGYEGFEDDLARRAADHGGLTLIEDSIERKTDDLRSIEDIPLLARPTRQILGVIAHRGIAAACDRLGTDTVMAGHGGDALFLQRSIAGEMLADRLQLQPFRGGLLKAAYETATLLERPVRSVLTDAVALALGLRKAALPSPMDTAKRNRAGLLTPDVIDAIPPSHTMHPWAAKAAGLPACKAQQLQAILVLKNYHAVLALGRGRRSINPYISQPILEFALRTPTYVLAEGGVDRALARAAFQDLIPPEIARRTEKGFINNRLLGAFQKNETFVRELVLDGQLIAQPWINRPAAEALLTREGFTDGRSLFTICNLVVVEAWLRSLSRAGSRLPAI